MIYNTYLNYICSINKYRYRKSGIECIIKMNTSFKKHFFFIMDVKQKVVRLSGTFMR